MDVVALLLAGLGAFLGGSFRAWLGEVGNFWSRVPYGTMMANVLGSWLIGVFLVCYQQDILTSRDYVFFAAGFCGGLTTFSTFSLETFKLFLRGHHGVALLYWSLSVGMTILSVYLGILGTRCILG